MLPQHKDIFFTVAQQVHCWIGLREPNNLSDKWIGKPGFIAKGVSCKAKTADKPHYVFAGLVVDPILCPEAFETRSLQDAKDKWVKFAPGNRLPPGYTRDASGREKGLVKYLGKAIHADFDLMAICKAGPDDAMEFTSEEEAKQLFRKAEQLLNSRFNPPMIMHGSEFMYKDGVGARESEVVFYFGPNRKFQSSHSSMPKHGH